MFFLRIIVLKVDRDLIALFFLFSFIHSDDPKYLMKCFPFSVNPCFTLNLKISISCSLLLYNVVNLAFWSSVWYVFEVLLNTVLKAFSCSLSSFRQSDAREKCHTNWQYIRWGIIADLYSCNFAQDGIRFFNLFKIPTCLLTVLQTSLVWRLKCNFSSRFTPSILIDRDCSICSPP